MMLPGILCGHWRGNVIIKSVKARLDAISSDTEYSITSVVLSNKPCSGNRRPHNLNLRQGEDGCTKMLLICSQVKDTLY